MPRSAPPQAFIPGLLVLALWGCAVGPDFHRPAPPSVTAYTPEPVTPADGGESGQTVVWGKDVEASWWTQFGSTALDDLVTRALKANPDLESAKAALLAARETYLAQRGAILPSVGADYNVGRQQASGTPAPPLASNNNLFTLHTAQVTIAYAPDIFGGLRRQIESAKAQAEAQRDETQAAYLTLTANVVLGAVQEASLVRQRAATVRVIEAETEILTVFRRQKALGQASGLDVATQEAALAQAEALLPSLDKQLAQQRDQLAYLTGRTPSEVTEPALDLDRLTLPATLPLSLPSTLVGHRPDILAAEANLHAASAQVGVAIAARLPAFNLTAAAGGSSTALSNLFSQGNGFWALSADAAQPLFEGGALLHRQRAAEAAFAQAKAQYRGVVLGAFQNVADTLEALRADGQAEAAALRAEASAETALSITRRQLAVGQVAAPAVLLSEQAYQQALVARLQARASRYADTVALFQALGGGWWNRPDV